MIEPPSYIDGAKILKVVRDDLSLISSSVPLEEKSHRDRPAHLAIGRYLRDETLVLFTCNHAWAAVEAETFDTLFEAMDAAQQRFTKYLRWSPIPGEDR